MDTAVSITHLSARSWWCAAVIGSWLQLYIQLLACWTQTHTLASVCEWQRRACCAALPSAERSQLMGVVPGWGFWMKASITDYKSGSAGCSDLCVCWGVSLNRNTFSLVAATRLPNWLSASCWDTAGMNTQDGDSSHGFEDFTENSGPKTRLGLHKGLHMT